MAQRGGAQTKPASVTGRGAIKPPPSLEVADLGFVPDAGDDLGFVAEAAPAPTVDPRATNPALNPIRRQQQLNYPTATELGKPPGRATGSAGVMDSFVQGVESGVQGLAHLPATLLGGDDLVGNTIGRALGYTKPLDTAAADAMIEMHKAGMAKDAAERAQDPNHPFALNPNATRTIVNTIGGAMGAGPVSPTTDATPMTSPAPIINRAIEAGPVEAGTEAAIQVLGPLLGLKLASGAMGQISQRFTPSTNLGARSTSAIANMIESGVKNDLVNEYASQTKPIWQQAAAELGVDAAEFPSRGVTPAGREGLISGGKRAIEIADHAVDIANRPFDEVMQKYGKVSIEPPGRPPEMTVKGRVLADLNQAINENANNPALQNSLRALLPAVEKLKDFQGLQDLKALAGKKSTGIFDAAPGRAIDMSADAAYSWKILGDAIRANMYPELSSLSGIDLSTAGRLEAIVMDARDGIRQHFYKDVLNPHNKRMQQGYFEYLSGGSWHQKSLMRRALMLEPTPAGKFNQKFAQGLETVPPLQPMPGAQGPAVPHYPKGPLGGAPEALTGEQAPIFPGGGRLGFTESQDFIDVKDTATGPAYGQLELFGPPTHGPDVATFFIDPAGKQRPIPSMAAVWDRLFEEFGPIADADPAAPGTVRPALAPPPTASGLLNPGPQPKLLPEGLRPGDNFIRTQSGDTHYTGVPGPIPPTPQATVTPTGSNPILDAYFQSAEFRGAMSKAQQAMTPTAFELFRRTAIERLRNQFDIIMPDLGWAEPLGRPRPMNPPPSAGGGIRLTDQ